MIGGDVVDAIGRDLAELRNDKVVHPDRLRLSLRAQLPAAILEVPNWAALGRHTSAPTVQFCSVVDVGDIKMPPDGIDIR